MQDGPPRDVFARVDELRRIGVRVPEVTALAHRFGSTVPGAVPLTIHEGHRFVKNLLGRCGTVGGTH